MSYDVVITRSEATSLFGQTNIQNIPEIHEPQTVDISSLPVEEDAEAAVATESTCCDEDVSLLRKSEMNTPSRSRGTSSRLISAFTQFYGNDEDDGQSSTAATSTNGTPTRSAVSADESYPEIKGRVESKLMSMWHNVKYGWSGKMRSSFSKEQPVWLLGRCYHRKYSQPSSMESSAEMTTSLENKLFISGANVAGGSSLSGSETQNALLQQHTNDILNPIVQEFGTDAIEGDLQWEEGIDGFKRDFNSRLWMTYRREFPIMNGSNYTSDCGWGCMLRSGQMLLAQAMVCHFLGRAWRWDSDTQIFSTHEDQMHRKIIRWFGDNSSKSSPFSIHTLVTLGQESGKKPGDWYGPASVSHLLKQAVKLASQENADFDDLHVYVAQDCTVYIQDILDECLVPDPSTGPIAPWQQIKKTTESTDNTCGGINTTTSSSSSITNSRWKSLILLVPLRLGTEKLNPIYGNSLKTLLSTEYCIGIIGGRPKHSLYFVGFQEDKLIHLDPHYCQEVVDVHQENFCVQTFHCKSPRKLKLSKLDPCCCIGFYCPTKVDFDNFVISVKPYLLPARTTPSTDRSNSPNQSSNDCNYPMFVFSRSRNCEQQTDGFGTEFVYKPLNRTMKSSNAAGGGSSMAAGDDDDDDESEEFVII